MSEPKTPRKTPPKNPRKSPDRPRGGSAQLEKRIEDLFADMRHDEDEVDIQPEQAQVEDVLPAPVPAEEILPAPVSIPAPSVELPALEAEPPSAISTQPVVEQRAIQLAAETPSIQPVSRLEPAQVSAAQAPQQPMTDVGRQSLAAFRPIFQAATELGAGQAERDPGSPPSPAGAFSPAVMAVPFRLEQSTLGLVEVVDPQPARTWNEDERWIVEQVTDQLSLALQNARLFQETQAALSEVETLYRVTRSATSSFELNDNLREMLSHILDAVGFDCGLISISTSAGSPLTLAAQVGLPDALRNSLETKGFEHTLCEQAYVRSEKIGIPDLLNPGPWTEVIRAGQIKLEGLVSMGLYAYQGVPLISKGITLGTMCIFRRTTGPIASSALSLMEAACQQIGIAVENARLYQDEQRRRQIADTLLEIAGVVSASLELKEVTERLLDQLPNLIEFRKASLHLVQGETRTLIAGRGFDVDATLQEPDELHRSVYSDPLVSIVMRTRQPLILSDTYNDSRWQVFPQTADIRSWLCAPLVAGEQIVGLLFVDNDVPGSYTSETAQLAAAFAAQAAVAIQNARLFEQMQTSLAETAALYQGSAAVNAAASYHEILIALQENSILGANPLSLTINLFDPIWQADQLPEKVEVIARLILNSWQKRNPLDAVDSYTVSEYPSAIRYLKPGAPLFIGDTETDSRLDDQARQLFAQRLGAGATLFVPLVVGGRFIGFLNSIYAQKQNFSEEDLRRVMALASQASIAVQNLRSLQLAEQRALESQQRSQELSLVNRVVAATVSSPDLRTVLDAVANELIEVFALGNVVIALLDDLGVELSVVSERSRTPSEATMLGFKIPVPGNPAFEQVIARKQFQVISQAQVNPLIAPLHSWMRLRQVQTIAIFPLITGGKVVGTVSMDLLETGLHVNGETHLRTFSEAELALATTLVGQISTSIQNANLYDQTQKALAETGLLYQASAGLNTVEDYEDILEILRSVTLLGAATASEVAINLFDRPWQTEAGSAPVSTERQPAGEMPEWAAQVVRWPSKPGTQVSTQNTLPTSASPLRLMLAGSPTAHILLRPDVPTIISDAASDPLLDAAARAYYVDRLDARALIFVPLTVGGQFIGFLSAAYNERTRFPDQDVRVLLALAGQAAVAIQNLRLLEETRRRAGQLETAAEIARDTSGTLALDTLLNRSVNLIRERYGYYHASIFLLDESGVRAVVRESTGAAGEEMKRRGHSLDVGSQSIIGRVTASGDTLVINDISQDVTHRPNPLLPDTRAELAIPLKIGVRASDGSPSSDRRSPDSQDQRAEYSLRSRIIGALDVQAVTVDAFNPDDVAVLQVLADQLAVAVDNARSYELAQKAVAETRQRAREMEDLYQVSQALSSTTPRVDDVAHTIARSFIEVMDVEEASVSLMNPLDETLTTFVDLVQVAAPQTAELALTTDLAHPSGRVQPRQIESRSTASQETFRLEDFPTTRRVMNSLQPAVIQASDSTADPAELAYMKGNQVQTLVILPLATKGAAFGIIEVEHKSRPRRFDTAQLSLMLTMANSSAAALENARLYEEQVETSEKLRELDKLKSQFLANMSHELRTPLNSIIGFSRVIIKGIDGPTTDLQQQDLTAIHSAGQHLLQLINDVLDISKIEAGKMELAFDDGVNIPDLVNSAMSTAIGLTKDKPIKLEKDIQIDIPAVRADPTRIRQVLINFLSNAAKFTDQGIIRVAVRAQIGPAGTPLAGRPEVYVGVTDTGPGIDEHGLKMLFQPFTQVDSSPTRKVGGTGLGLSISRLLVDMHGGRIGVESKVGEGSTFYFTLPLPYEAPVDTGPGANARTILVIEDDRQVIKLYERYLQPHGYTIVPLTDPFQAVTMAKELLVAQGLYAITLDIMMPERDGWQVMQELKADPETRQVPVIICSIIENQEKGFSLGAVDYLPKPILEDDLVNALRRFSGVRSLDLRSLDLRSLDLQQPDSAASGAIHSVLVVDDDADDLRLVKKILDPRGFDVRLAQGGLAGLVELQTNPPHAVILDLFMPELDGFALLESIRSEPALHNIPVIIFTAGDLNDEQRERLAQFSQQLIHKSAFTDEDLLTSLEALLNRLSGNS